LTTPQNNSDEWEIIVFTFAGPKMPKWARTIMLSKDGRLKVPVGMFMSEKEALFACGYDGSPFRVYNRHIYVSSKWIRKEFMNNPEKLKLLDAIEKQASTLDPK
jgi:hypothetical protein